MAFFFTPPEGSGGPWSGETQHPVDPRLKDVLSQAIDRVSLHPPHTYGWNQNPLYKRPDGGYTIGLPETTMVIPSVINSQVSVEQIKV